MARVVVTGGAGYVGRFIVERLLRAGYEPVVAGRSDPGPYFFSTPVEFRPFELDPRADNQDMLEDVDAVIHCAFSHVPGRYRGGEGEDPKGFVRANQEGTQRLLADAKAAGVGRFIFMSSRAVYGTPEPGEVLHERGSAIPDTLYGQVKRAGEEAARMACEDGFTTVSLRVTGVYGPAGDGASHKWEKLFADYLGGKKIASRVATEVHGDDVAEAVLLFLSEPVSALSGRLYNVSDLLIDHADILAPLKEATGAFYPLPERGDASAVNAMSTDKLKTLDWLPGGKWLFDKTLTELVTNYVRRARY